jgi:hypothetical protein
MEMDSVQAITYVACQLWLTNIVETSLVVHCASLMEFSEESIKINYSSRVDQELAPVRTVSHNFVLALKLLDNLLEIPWESKHVTMFLLTENNISSNFLIVGLNACLLSLSWLIRGLNGAC